MAKYIDRDSLIEWLKRIRLIDLSNGLGICRVIMEDDFKKAIKNMPENIIVDVAPVRHGRWEQCFEDWRKQIEGDKCSICGFEHYGALITHYHYCPNCGAQMHEDDFCSYGECREGNDEK